MAILVSLLLVSTCGVLYLLYEVIKQQGRILLRLDGIAERLGLHAPSGAQAMPAGLAVGTPFAPFTLPDLTGKQVALEDFRGKQVLLVNWSPHCGFCGQIASILARLQDEFYKHDVTLVLAAFGDATANRTLADEHGLTCVILLQQEAQPLEAFHGLGTPVAYLLDEEGRVAKPLAVGADQVPALARDAVGAASESALIPEHTLLNMHGMPGSGPGTELKKLLERVGLHVTPDCPCNARAALMDRNGCDWCARNIDTIIGWLREEASKRGLVFLEPAARMLVRKAIARARRAQVYTREHGAREQRETPALAAHLPDTSEHAVALEESAHGL
jgi:peroxiredoxin